MAATPKQLRARFGYLAKVIAQAGGDPTQLRLDHYSPGDNPYTWALVWKYPDSGGEHQYASRRFTTNEMDAWITLTMEILSDPRVFTGGPS